MSGIRSKNTKPEIRIRSLLHRNGYRFRLHQKDLPGKPDIALRKYRVAIFVNGCFWHGHENCKLFRLPKSRTLFWEEKIGRNKMRDLEKQNRLQAMEWRILTIWECAVKGTQILEEAELLLRIGDFMDNPSVDIAVIRGSI